MHYAQETFRAFKVFAVNYMLIFITIAREIHGRLQLLNSHGLLSEQGSLDQM